MFCHICGTQIPEDAGFCHNCGTKVVHDSTKLQVSDTSQRKQTNVWEPFRKSAKIISWILVPIVILVLITSGALKNAFDALVDFNEEMEARTEGAIRVPDMQSADDIFSSGSLEGASGNTYPDYGYDDGTMGYDGSVEDYDGQYPGLDSSLVGRWRSYDGGTLEFTDGGIIASCDFQCWSLIGRKPDLIYWESLNGRVTCTAFFDHDVEYWIWTQYEGEKDEREMINIGGSDYYRISGTYGGIVGMWGSVWGEVWSHQFNEDGSGMWNGTYPTSWYTYTTDDGTSALRYTIVNSTYFDYTITGDVLTVFLSDSSRVYTKVGD